MQEGQTYKSSTFAGCEITVLRSEGNGIWECYIRHSPEFIEKSLFSESYIMANYYLGE